MAKNPQNSAQEKFLPISVQDFGQMIAGNFVYIDKTRYIYEMARVPQGYYFLSRPRRFGKSLLVSTLKALFEGRKELFKGLWIEDSAWEWKPHPVLAIDFSEVDSTDVASLQISLSNRLDFLASLHGLQLRHKLLADRFVELMLETSKKYRSKIVVLMDEYDKPIISHLGKGEAELRLAQQSRELLKNFFGVLKGAHVAAALRFVFITGVSKFSKVSLFSELNNLQELTMHADYAGMLGYTQEELEKYFGDRIAEFAQRQQSTTTDVLRKLRAWYNGYRFTKAEAQVYNPFSIVNALSEYDFKTYWFETGTPSFLVSLIKEKDYSVAQIEGLEVPEAAFSTYDLEKLSLEALLFQTGYVTIHDYALELYRLGYPNQEVKSSFSAYLYDSFLSEVDTVLKAQFKRLHQYLMKEDLPQFIETTNAILSAIPYAQHQQQGEAFYHTVFYLMVAASGVLVQTEPLSSHGRMDIAVEFDDKVYVIELKCDQPAEQALAQIRAKKYHEKYVQSGRKIFLLGIDFDTQQRAITEWKMESA
jgi:hypothetical protein